MGSVSSMVSSFQNKASQPRRLGCFFNDARYYYYVKYVTIMQARDIMTDLAECNLDFVNLVWTIALFDATSFRQLPKGPRFYWCFRSPIPILTNLPA